MAQDVAPDARVVYVDNDPIVLAHARALLTSEDGGETAFIQPTCTTPGRFWITRPWSPPWTWATPVAVLLVAVLMYFRDTDHPNPFEMVATLMEQMPSGSYLAITHPAPDFNPEEPPANPRLVYYWAGIGRKP